MSKNRGFTLLELMIVVAVIAIISAIALPGYSQYVRKARRSDVEQAMQQVAMLQERFRADCPTYANGFGFACATLSTLTLPSNPYSAAYYTLTTTTTAGTESTAYTISAAPNGSQASDKQNGTTCGTLAYTYSSGVVSKTPADCWAK